MTKSKRTRIIVVLNQKGGVGKTAFSFHLAKLAAENGERVLAVDMDTQGNFSQFLTGDLEIQENVEGGAGVLFEEKGFSEDALTNTLFENIFLLHGHKGLDAFNNNVAVEERVYSPEFRRQLHSLPFDVIVIDTPPAVGILHLSPLIWADKAVIPMEPAQSAVAGFQSVLQAIELSQELNPALTWVGVLNRFNRNSVKQREIVEEVHKLYGAKIAPTFSNRTAVADAMQGEPPAPVWKMPGAKKELRDLWRNFCADVIR